MTTVENSLNIRKLRANLKKQSTNRQNELERGQSEDWNKHKYVTLYLRTRKIKNVVIMHIIQVQTFVTSVVLFGVYHGVSISVSTHWSTHRLTMSSATASRKPHVVGGKLKLKGSGGSSGGVRRAPPSVSSDVPVRIATQGSSEGTAESSSNKASSKAVTEEYLTPSQKRHLQRKIEKEKEEAKKLSKTSFRDRVEIFNSKLASMTEHNDIPRISAAGNG